jgi:NDP-sugar pyrophosphorylase family protein
MTIGALFTGGYGKRLQSIAGDIPKTLLPLKDDYLILDRQLLDFKYAGINQVYLLSGYRGELIEKRYGHEWKGINITHIIEVKPMGTLWALRNLYSHLDSDILLRNGDTICDLNLNSLISYSTSQRTLATMVVAKMVSPFGIVSIHNGYVSEFVEKPILNHYVNVGCYHLKPAVKTYLKRQYSSTEIEKTLFDSLSSDGKIKAFKFGGYWKAVDSVKDYEEIKKEYDSREDYDFGHVTMQRGIVECTTYKDRVVIITGKGKVKVVEGEVNVNGAILSKGKSKSVSEESQIRSVEESKFSLTGDLSITNPKEV